MLKKFHSAQKSKLSKGFPWVFLQVLPQSSQNWEPPNPVAI